MVYGISNFVNQVFTKITAEDYVNKATANDSTVTAEGGADLVAITGNGNNIDTGDGDSTVWISGNENSLSAGADADSVYIVGDNNAANVGDGTNVASVVGNSNELGGGAGADMFSIQGNGNTASTGDGDDIMLALGDNNNLDAGGGNNAIGFIGNGYNVNFNQSGSAGVTHLAFWGDDTNITGGDGAHVIETLDKMTSDPRINSILNYWGGLQRVVETTSEDFSYDETTTTSTIISRSDVLGLSAAEQAIAETVNLQEEVNGRPKYLIARGADGQNHLYQYQSSSTYKCVTKVKQGSNYLYVKSYNPGSGTITTTYEDTTTTVRTTGTKTTVEDKIKGVKNTNIQLGNFNSGRIALTVDKNSSTNIEAGDAHGSFIDVQAGQVFSSTSTTSNVQKEIISRIVSQRIFTGTGEYFAGSGSTGSPLIVDFNKDGKVSAAAGKGVDVDNNGTADGAATGGDKMLAMSDMNGNGKIDGSEVFGDKTVDPFTGKAINAKNGFEALKQVAISAEKATGKSCMDSAGNVDLQALKEALATVGINLGFISDDNVTQLEDLTNISSINVNNYKEQSQSGDVQHNQLGSLTYDDGSQGKVDDVWFKLR